jgi:uncharacterized 2Fe-2S/4Fe-4S cluster protein (DUF4445 family)
MDHKIIVNSKSKTIDYSVENGTNLLQFLLENNYEMYTPCNGQGICGKCYVKLAGANIAEPSSKELKILGSSATSEGYRLSCNVAVNSDLEVFLDKSGFEAKVMTEGKQAELQLSPSITKKFVQLSRPSLEDQRTDSERIKEFSSGFEINSLDMLKYLPQTLREKDYNVTLVYNDDKLIGVEAGDTTSALYGVGVDIGTTTIAAYLLDLNTGARLATYSCLNPQKKFGADVISRIKHTMETENGSSEMHRTIIDGLNTAICTLAKKAEINSKDIYEITLVGNTTMMHFLLDLSARGIAAAPFISVTTQKFVLKASELGINMNPYALAAVVPSVAAYIGADTVSAVLASRMYEDNKMSLLVDFGTNGEIVLGNKDRLLSCSAAAGPAFEGANIRNGVGGINGAIDKFKVEKTISYTTIGREKPVGICGTGLVDIVSELYRSGIVDETGRLETDISDRSDFDPDMQDRIVNIDGMNAFLIADQKTTGNQKEIAITQKDIRELQNAKAAIAAGIKVLAKRAGISLNDIEKVYLAGGFGSYISIESALNIGLIPLELTGRVETIGNAAGIGAIEVLLSKESLETTEVIKKKIEYIELSACKEFNDFFIDSMMFSEE